MWSVNSTICNRYHLLVSQILDDTVKQDFEFDENKAINYPYWNTQKKKKARIFCPFLAQHRKQYTPMIQNTRREPSCKTVKA